MIEAPVLEKVRPYSKESQPQIMLNLEFEPDTQEAIPYIHIDRIRFRCHSNVPSLQAIFIHSGNRVFTLTGEHLRELYGHLLKQVVSLVRYSPGAEGTKIQQIKVEENEQE